MKKFTGIMPALVTPLCEDETVNVPVLKKLVSDLADKGADGFYVGGATGEGIALRQDVREVLCEESIASAKGKPCIVHVASADFSEAVALAKHAEAHGAAAISAIPPLFFRYNEDDVYNYYKTLAEAVHIPMVIYYNPAAGFTVNAEFAARCFEVDNITAIKWTSSDFFGMIRLKEMTHGEMNIINGPDEMLICGLASGADAGIGTTYNYILPLIRGVYDNFRAGNIDAAREYQMKADKIIKVLLSYTTIPASKVVMEKMGYAVGNAAFPMKRYTEAQKDEIIAAFRAAGLEL